jgi:catechol 2,3-dioxygenase-like lactoylglutathione lyase family enzyme
MTEAAISTPGRYRYGSAMGAEKLNAVLAVDDLAGAVAWWEALLGVAPTFVEGDRWAQFDLGPSRLALAGADRAFDGAGVMVKVDDLDAAVAALAAAGHAVGPIEAGPHERRAVTAAPGGGAVVLYAPA